MSMPDFDEEVRNFMKDAVQMDADAASKRVKKIGYKELGKKAGEFGVGKVVEKGVEEVISHLAPITDVSVNVGSWSHTINPVMWAARPWLAAKDVMKIAFELEKIYAVMNEGNGIWSKKYHCKELYECTCGFRHQQAFVMWNERKFARYGTGAREGTHKNCQAVRDFVKEQKDAKVAKIAINATAVSIPFYLIYAASRSIYKRTTGTIHQDRAQNAQHLVRSAMPILVRKDDDVQITERGCRRAQALIALLCGELDLKNPKTGISNYPKTMAALVHPDGWDKIAKAMSASIVFDAGHGKK